MFQLNYQSHTSVYEQIVDNIKEQIIKGALKENSLGSREGIENPHSGQQCLLESNLSPFEERIRI